MTFDVVAFIGQVVPPILRKAKILALLEAYLKGISLLSDGEKNYYPGKLQEATTSPITIVLKGYLNNLFDSTNRGILINTIDTSTNLSFKNISLTQPVVFSETTPVVFYGEGRVQNPFDYEVVVPNALASAELEKRIKAICEQHRLAGKIVRYKYSNGTIF